MKSGTIEPSVWPLENLWDVYAHDPEGHLLIPHVGGAARQSRLARSLARTPDRGELHMGAFRLVLSGRHLARL